MPAPLIQATGRRKRSTARVLFREGTGQITVNGKEIESYFNSVSQRFEVAEPLVVTETQESYDISANIVGGGLAGQAGALKLGIARGLVALNPDFREKLKAESILTRDSREKESKKYGLKKARKASQYSKR